MTRPLAGLLLDELIEDGNILDAKKVRRRFRLGYPLWFILEEELGQEDAIRLLSRHTSLPVLEDDASIPELLDTARCPDPSILKARRWAPLADGRVLVADPFIPLPDTELLENEMWLAPASRIDAALKVAFPSNEEDPKKLRRLGRLLLDAGAIDEEDLALALDEQERSGGRLGEILLAQGVVDATVMTKVLAERFGLPAVEEGEIPKPLLPAHQARVWQAVALANPSEAAEAIEPEAPLPVAFADPTPEVVEAVQEYLGRRIQPRMVGNQMLNALFGAIYAEDDVRDAVKGLFEKTPHFSAFGSRLSPPQILVSSIVGFLTILGLFVNFFFTVVVATTVASILYILYTLYRLYTAWHGWKAEATLRPSPDDLRSLDERELPVYTMLLPVFKEKPSTMRTLFEALGRFDYPKHKLDGILLMEGDDEQTRRAWRRSACPAGSAPYPFPKAKASTKTREKVRSEPLESLAGSRCSRCRPANPGPNQKL